MFLYYNILYAHTNSRGHIFIFPLPSCMPPAQFTQHFHREHLRSVYFRCQVHFLLFLRPVFDFLNCIDKCQKGSSSQYSTQPIQQRFGKSRCIWFSLAWFLCLIAFQTFIGYLMPKQSL